MKKILIVMSAAAGLAFAGCRPQNPDVPAVREFIRDNWHTTVQHCTADTATLIGLPYPYTVPTAGAMFREMYYWDTFFTNEGLVRDGHPELAKGNTDNLLYMVRRFGKVYNGSRTYYEARSQTPYLSMMVDRIYRLTGDKQWLADAYETLKEEYGFWMRERLTPTGLNRYGSSASDALVDEFLVTGGKRLGTDLFDKGYTPERLHKRGELRPLRAGAGPHGRDPGMDRQSGASPGTDTRILLRPRSETVLRLRLCQRPALRRAFGSGLLAPLHRRRTP